MRPGGFATLRKVHGVTEEEIAGEVDRTAKAVREHLEEAVYRSASHVVNTLPLEPQNVLFATLDSCRLAVKRCTPQVSGRKRAAPDATSIQ